MNQKINGKVLSVNNSERGTISYLTVEETEDDGDESITLLQFVTDVIQLRLCKCTIHMLLFLNTCIPNVLQCLSDNLLWGNLIFNLLHSSGRQKFSFIHNTSINTS